MTDTSIIASTQPTHTIGERSLIAVFVCFAVVDGGLLLANLRWAPQKVDLLFPLWAAIAASLAISFSRAGVPTFRRFSIPLRVSGAIVSLAAGAGVVITLREVWMSRLIVPDGTKLSRCVFILMIVLVVPLLEEILFRGIILERLLKNKTVIFAILLSSVAAAVCHDAILPALLEHAIIGSVYVWQGRSLRASFLVHMAINTIALLPGMRH
jgi:membrane protease YdiL (CAAX protease family)